MPDLCAEIEPYASGHRDVGDGHQPSNPCRWEGSRPPRATVFRECDTGVHEPSGALG